MSSSPESLRNLRRAWRCDCDGQSHRDPLPETAAERIIVSTMADHIEEITGHRPHSCPWRCFAEPIVGEVIRISTLAKEGLGTAALGDDPDAVLLDALPIYIAAKESTKAHDMEQDRKKREAKHG